MTQISKTYESIVALNDVSLEIAAGSVHGLVGENGAGKSTLMKVLAGLVQADTGTISLKGEELTFHSPADALGAGISTVTQELSLLANLTIAENMFLAKEPLKFPGLVDQRTMATETKKRLADFDIQLDPHTFVSKLSIADKQLIEIAHALSADAAVYVLDEPTAALNSSDVDVLKRRVKELAAEGRAVIYISHRLDEIFELCDTVTVLKDGKNVATHKTHELTTSDLIALMVGRELGDLFPPKADQIGELVLEVDDLRLTPETDPISIHLRRGEIVALAGLEGQGQRDILRSLIGQYQPVAGTVQLNGATLSLPLPAATGVRRLQGAGVAFLPEDRKDEGLFLELSSDFNASLGLHARRSEWALARGYKDKVGNALEALRVRATAVSSAVSTLSGGNQQKVLLARHLVAEPTILLIEEPTRGVDVGAKADIYQLLRDFADRGGAVLVLSRETIELIGLCDRLYVVQGGSAVAEFGGGVVTEHGILDAAMLHASSRTRPEGDVETRPPSRTTAGNIRSSMTGRVGRQGAWPIPLALLLTALTWLSIGYAEFRSVEGLSNFLTQATPLLLVAIGQMIVVLVRGLDLSVPSVVGLTTVILASGGSPVVLIGTALVCGAAVGLANGLIVTKLEVHPIIATLAMQWMLLGVARMIRPTAGGDIPDIIEASVSAVGALLWLLLAVAVAWKILHGSRFGLRQFAIGGGLAAGQAGAVRTFGINDRRYIISSYVMSALFATCAGMFLAGRIVSGDADVGIGLDISSITAVALGGTLLSGGVGSLQGTVFGALVLAAISTAMNLTNLSPFLRTVLTGVILLAVVATQRRKTIGL
jgi:ribose transport system ATP-binding protein